jgi:hypothetical protein
LGWPTSPQKGRRDDTLALIQEAGTIAEDSGAHGIMRSVDEERRFL